MDPFTLQRRVCREILKTRPSAERGMAAALKAVAAAPGGKAWAKAEAAAPDWAALEARWVAWFDALLKEAPPPEPTALLWFERPSDLNPALTSVSGYAELDTADEAWGLEAGRHWPVEESGATQAAALLDLPELDAMFAAAGWGGDDGPDETLSPGFYALASAATVLLVLNGLPRTRLLALAGVDRVGVVTGWAEGGEEPVGLLSESGWGTMRRSKSTKARGL